MEARTGSQREVATEEYKNHDSEQPSRVSGPEFGRVVGWLEFVAKYEQAIAEARAGKVDAEQASLHIPSLGAFGVEVATPIVVPPAMATLFVGKAHERMINDGGMVYPAEVTTLSLTFDHRVVNGAGAAAFLQDVKTQIGGFRIPD